MTMSGHLGILLCLVALIIAGIDLSSQLPAMASQQPSEIRPLTAGISIERELAGGQIHLYQLSLTEGRYIHLIVEQRGIDVVVALSGADGTKHLEIDSPNGTMGPEELPFVVKSSGQYVVTVRSLEEKAPAGKYEIRIGDERPATEKDEICVAGVKAMVEAAGLMRRNDAKLFRLAIDKYEEAAKAWRAVGEPAKEAQALYQISRVYLMFGESKKSIEYLDRFLLLSRQTKDAASEAMALNAIGTAWLALGDRRKALEYLQQALNLGDQTIGLADRALLLSNVGTTYAFLGEMEKAFDFFSRALSTLHQAATSSANVELRRALRLEEAKILINLCGVHTRLGDYQQAIDAGNQTLAIIRDQREVSSQNVRIRELEGTALNILALAMNSIGETQKYLEYNLESLKILEQIGNQRGQAITLNDIGQSYHMRGEYARAADSFQRALALAKKIGDPVTQSAALQHLGWEYEMMGERNKAFDALNEALSLAHNAEEREGELVALRRLGVLYMRAGDHHRAVECLQTSLQICRQTKRVNHEATTMSLLADAHRGLGDLSQALIAGQEALRITESLRAGVAGSDRRSAFFSTVQGRYDSHIETLMRLHDQSPHEGYATTALEISERARARSLLEMLAESGTDIRAGVEAGLLERERSLSRQIRSKADAQMRLLGSKQEEKQAAPLTKEIEDLTSQLKEVETEIRRTSPRYAALKQPTPLSAREIQQLLDNDTLLLEYQLGEQSSYLWAVTAAGLSSYRLPPRAEIEASTRKVYNLLIKRPNRGEPPDPQLIAQAEALSLMLLGPVDSQINGKRLLIVAPGVLAYLPFAALPAPTRKNKPAGIYLPLIATNEIVNLPSASVLSVIRRETEGRKPAKQTIAILADPVFESNDPRIARTGQQRAAGETPSTGPAEPAALTRAINGINPSVRGNGLSRLAFSRQEANAIASLVPQATTLKVTDFNASRTVATSQELSQYRILHFATHGLLNNEQPELSGLVFSLVDENGMAQDGFLRLHEIFDLKINADLVVLSACETGLGKEIRGEGLIGLTRGFMYAGAPRVVASLWKIDDLASAELMKLFYQAMLKDGLRPAAALRTAQDQLSKQKRWASPYFWAGFVLQGEWK